MAKFGIDISRHQGNIDLSQAKKEGVEYVIIKCGGADDGLYEDSKYQDNYKNARDSKLLTGAYFFGNAKTEEEAIIEATYCYSLVKDKTFELPIYYDVEGNMLKGDNITDVSIAFIKALQNLGIKKVGLYSSLYPLNTQIDTKKVKETTDASIWVAYYGTVEPNLTEDVEKDLWQFGGTQNFIRSNKIAGVVVDQNYLYADFGEFIEEEIQVIPDNPKSVRIKEGAVDLNSGKKFANYVYNNEYDIIEMNDDSIVFGIGTNVTGKIAISDAIFNDDSVPEQKNELPKAEFVHYVGEKVEYNKIYGSTNSTNGVKPLYTVGEITKIFENCLNPYMIGNGTGFINDDCIVREEEKVIKNNNIQVGDKVNIVTCIDYDRNIPFKDWHKEYVVSELIGNRAVISIIGGQVYAAVDVNNLKKA